MIPRATPAPPKTERAAPSSSIIVGVAHPVIRPARSLAARLQADHERRGMHRDGHVPREELEAPTKRTPLEHVMVHNHGVHLTKLRVRVRVRARVRWRGREQRGRVSEMARTKGDGNGKCGLR